jgi:hypothetical protein
MEALAHLDVTGAAMLLEGPGAGAPALTRKEKEGQSDIHRTSARVSLISHASNNPGNNLHVSGLSHKVDTRDLEAAFAKIGRVCFCVTVSPYSDWSTARSKKPPSCTIPTPASPVGSGL